MAIQLHPKISATVVAGAITSLIVAEANRRGLTLAPDEAAAITTLLVFLAGYFMPTGDTVDAGGGQAAVPTPAPVVAPQAVVVPPAQPAAPTISAAIPTPQAGAAPSLSTQGTQP